jgi:hypothetical protein
MDKILYEEIVLVPVAKADFQEFNALAEKLLLARNPNRKDLIREERQLLLEKGARILQEFREQEEIKLLQINSASSV